MSDNLPAGTLVVIAAFGKYNRGDLITQAGDIAKALASNPYSVVPLTQPAPTVS